MKINENELSTELQKKINILSNVKNNDEAGFLFYDGEKFITRTIVGNKANPIISDNEIRTIFEHKFKKEEGYSSSFNDQMINKTVVSKNIPSFIVPLISKFEFKTDGNIIKQKVYSNYIAVLDDKGILYKVNKNQTNVHTRIEIMNILKTNFIQKNFSINSILDFELYDTGVLVSTELNGVYYLDVQNKVYEMKFAIYPVSIIKALKDGRVLCCTETEANSVNIFDFKTGAKVVTYNNLKKYDHQLPYSAIVNQENFYILGRSYSVNQSGRTLHYYRYNTESKIYENADYLVHTHKQNNDYQIKFFTEDPSSLYIAGVENDVLFIWKYNKDNMHIEPKEIRFDKIKITYDELEGFIIKNNKCYIVIDKRILSFDVDTLEIENNFLDLSHTLENQTFDYHSDKIYGYMNNEVFSSTIPERKYYKEIQVDVLQNAKTCNNITVCLRSNNGEERAAFIDGSTLQQVTPSYYMIINNSISIIKFTDIEIHNLIMKLKVPEETIIDALVVNENRLYYK